MKKYQTYKEIRACKITRRDLNDLIKKVTESFSEKDIKENLQISTDLPNISITEKDLESFLRHEELPQKIYNLSIKINDWENGISRYVSIRFSEYSGRMIIDGDQESWVMGKSIQLEKFFKSKQYALWFLRIPMISGIVFGLLFWPIGISVTYLIKQIDVLNIQTAIEVITIVFSIVLMCLLNKLHYIEIVLKEQKKSISSFFKDAIILLAAIATIVGFFLTVFIKR